MDGEDLYYDNNETVLFEVLSEEWHDQAPSAPADMGEQAASEIQPPYKIKGSMKAEGLGCTLWWWDAQEEEQPEGE